MGKRTRDRAEQERHDLAEFERFMASRRAPGWLGMAANDCRDLWRWAGHRRIRWLVLLSIPATLLNVGVMGEELYVYVMNDLAGFHVGVETPVRDFLDKHVPQAGAVLIFLFMLLGMPGLLAVAALPVVAVLAVVSRLNRWGS